LFALAYAEAKQKQPQGIEQAEYLFCISVAAGQKPEQ
jgi:hypothetical protein